MVVLLRWFDPPSSSFILGERFFSDYHQRQYWVPLSEISPELLLAVIAAEDQKFTGHYGFDFDAIKSAISEKRKRMRGASTITQQVAKNLFLWSGRSYLRKMLEAYIAILIETFWSKQRILEVYLNIVEFGRGVYGAEAASRLYFKKPAQNINRDEAALLAAVLPNPKRMHVKTPSEYVRMRAIEIKEIIKTLGGVEYLKF